jgi:hypothetical protein
MTMCDMLHCLICKLGMGYVTSTWWATVQMYTVPGHDWMCQLGVHGNAPVPWPVIC